MTWHCMISLYLGRCFCSFHADYETKSLLSVSGLCGGGLELFCGRLPGWIISAASGAGLCFGASVPPFLSFLLSSNNQYPTLASG